MPNIPVDKQILPPDYLTSALVAAESGEPVSGDDLLLAIEQSIGRRLPEKVRGLVCGATIPAGRTRGRPSNFGANRDFAMATIDICYPRLLRKFQNECRKQRAAARVAGHKLARAEKSPSELAYRFILKHRKKLFGAITWEALRNMHSQWQHGRFHSNKVELDSEDFDAAIERLFPSKS